MTAFKQAKLNECPMLTPDNDMNLKIKEKSENNENSAFKTFKAIVRETSVYQYIVELKEDALTEQGFLDLVKVPNLYVAGAGHFLKRLRQKKRLRRKDLAELLEVVFSTLKNWEQNRKKMPLCWLVKVAETLSAPKALIYSLIDQGEFSLKIALPVRFEKIRHIVQYLTPKKDTSGAYIHKCSMEAVFKIEEILKVKSKLYPKRQERIIHSSDLNHYLKTFFRYAKVSKINPPLTNEVELWYGNNIDLKCAVIIPCLQSDGSSLYNAQEGNIVFFGKNKRLHALLVDAMYYTYTELPSTYLQQYPSSSVLLTRYQKKAIKEIRTELMKLAGNTKTSPANGQTVEDYLKEPQPHLNYLINAPKIEQQIALRIFMSTEGSAGIIKCRGHIYPTLTLGCAHPVLADQLSQITKQLNIPLYSIHESRSWSGISNLTTTNLTTCIEFLKLGGFIKGTKISSKSPYHEGIDKDILLLGILEVKKRDMKSRRYRKLPFKKIHKEINKIIKYKQYKSADDYINYFSKDDTML
ncbi:MAG: hypothetical protein ACFFCD_04080 [Promethearchaeota archaeon]